MVHDLNSDMFRNSSTPISTRKSRRKSLHSSKSSKPDYLEDCSRPQDNAPATRILTSPVQRVEMADVAGNSEAVDLTSLKSRYVDEVPCSLRTEVPANSVSGSGNAERTLAETQSAEAAGVSKRSGSSPELAKRHGF